VQEGWLPHCGSAPRLSFNSFQSNQGASLRVAIYARVTTTDQNSELQIRELNDYAGKQGWEVIETYQDMISGAKSSRPGLNRLMEDARARKFDCLMVWKLDRFGRSLVDCLNNIKTLEDPGPPPRGRGAGQRRIRHEESSNYKPW
jgi:predicted site-specific integrase-resolvase